uniref:4Fe-4S ferredoxin iron-sulfur binding domain protein n=1 Tax=Methanococcus maripaludis (strain C6 / ATCC BAA-1332) TaxID=444158 RepID=A9AA02_METM6
MEILDKCVGCAGCVPFCPVGAISAFGKAEIDNEICTNCAGCKDYCPLDAISE